MSEELKTLSNALDVKYKVEILKYKVNENDVLRTLQELKELKEFNLDVFIKTILPSLNKLKYLNIPESPVSIDGKKLFNEIELISKNEYVVFLNKYALFQIIDSYLFFKIVNKILNDKFEVIDSKNHLAKNILYFVYKESFEYEKLEIENPKTPKDWLRALEKNALYDELNKLINSMLFELEQNEQKEAKQLFLNGLLDNIRIIEKFLFPIMLDCIIVKSNLKKDKYLLLYNLLPIILPDRTYLSEDYINRTGRYDTFEKYKIETVKSIFGI